MTWACAAVMLRAIATKTHASDGQCIRQSRLGSRDRGSGTRGSVAGPAGRPGLLMSAGAIARSGMLGVVGGWRGGGRRIRCHPLGVFELELLVIDLLARREAVAAAGAFTPAANGIGIEESTHFDDLRLHVAAARAFDLAPCAHYRRFAGAATRARHLQGVGRDQPGRRDVTDPPLAGAGGRSPGNAATVRSRDSCGFGHRNDLIGWSLPLVSAQSPAVPRLLMPPA